MAKGSFSQTLCLLTNSRTTLPDLKAALRKHDFDIVQERDAGSSWQFGGAFLTVAYRPEVNGYVAVDVVDRPWPDAMGDAKSDATTFAAWSMGHFGSWTFPGGLQRAAQHAWSWAPGRGIEQTHAGFIRIRLSYAFGASADSPVVPMDNDAIDELKFVSRLVLAIGDSAGVLCYFNPNGEVLLDHARFSKTWQACAADDQIPLPLWMNIRLFNLNDDLTMMDTVGNSQLDRMDIEPCFRARSMTLETSTTTCVT